MVGLVRWAVVILAAGQGKRLRSHLPKVLQPLAGRPLLDHVMDRATEVVERRKICVVVGHGKDAVLSHLKDQGVRTVVQEPQLGTGDALSHGLTGLGDDPVDAVLVLSGDVPLLRSTTVSHLQQPLENGAAVTLLTARLEEPAAYGRVVRSRDGSVERIVEARDATPHESRLNEVNAGVYCFRTAGLSDLLAALRPENSQGEYYLTDVVAAITRRRETVAAVELEDPEEMLGVNTRADLSHVAAVLNRRVLAALMDAGVTVQDPGTTWVEPGCIVEVDAVLEPGVILRRGTTIGPAAHIGAHSVLERATIAAGERVPPLSHITA